MTKDEYRQRVAAAIKKLSSLPELVPTAFILTNHKAEKRRQRVERACKRLESLPQLKPPN